MERLQSIGDYTPAMQQYLRIKNQYRDCILFFRMGDFYETFFEDAEVSSKVLGITLTSRGEFNNRRIPLAGIPYHAADTYIAKFVKAGYKLAVCEQVEDPKKAKGVVKREVVRIITPGSITEAELLNSSSNNYIMSLCCSGNLFGVALADISTNDLIVMNAREDELARIISIYTPSEVIVPYTLCVNRELVEWLKKQSLVNTLEDSRFDRRASYTELVRILNVSTLDGFGLSQDELSIGAAGALLNYLAETQRRELAFRAIKYVRKSDHMILDEVTLRNLEIVQNIREGTSKNTLLETIDCTKTPMGGRLLRNWVQQPLIDAGEIKRRLDSVEELTRKTLIREETAALLSRFQDLERLSSKLAYNNAKPRDLIGLKQTFKLLKPLKEQLSQLGAELVSFVSGFLLFEESIQLIERAISDEPGTLEEGNVIKKGYNGELDQLKDIRTNARRYIQMLEKRERERTRIKNLRIRYNRVFGYFIEVTKSNLPMVPKDYQRRQTLVNSERFVTDELKEQESQILSAEERSLELERELFQNVCSQLSADVSNMQDAAKRIAVIDVICSLAGVAVRNRYTRPVVDESGEIEIVSGRHAVIEQVEERFIPNDCRLNEADIVILTGPNMAGKSTYMRQNALIVLLAQMGSFVPADSAKIGIVDRIFTRVGAFDDLAHGQSTFMVEMTQTANIVNNATSRSLIILDEIGRGTSTFDGVALAWSVAEFIYNRIKAKTLFATHYHVLNKLAEKFERIKNYNIAVKEQGDQIIFLRKIVQGGTDKSYGIHVAKLSGMPHEVIERAQEIQLKLEEEDRMMRRITPKGVSKQSSLLEHGEENGQMG